MFPSPFCVLLGGCLCVSSPLVFFLGVGVCVFVWEFLFVNVVCDKFLGASHLCCGTTVTEDVVGGGVVALAILCVLLVASGFAFVEVVGVVASCQVLLLLLLLIHCAGVACVASLCGYVLLLLLLFLMSCHLHLSPRVIILWFVVVVDFSIVVSSCCRCCWLTYVIPLVLSRRF